MKLYIFNKKDKTYVSIYFKIFFAILLILFISIYFDFHIVFISIILILYFVFYIILNFFRTEHINGNLEGLLELKMDSINIKEKTFPLEKIDKIEILNTDIEGDFQTYKISFEPNFSNGTDNYIKLFLNSGENITFLFQQTKNEKINYNRKELINYYRKGKISWLALLDILEITDYNKIQNFKKSLK